MKLKITLYIGIGILVGFIMGLTTWAPWLSDIETEKIVRQRKNFIENNDEPEASMTEIKVNVMHAPFGRWVTTIEGGWYVGFWNGLR